MRSEGVRERLRWLAENQTGVHQDCNDSESNEHCSVCGQSIRVGKMACVITDEDGRRVVLDRACHAIWTVARNRRWGSR